MSLPADTTLCTGQTLVLNPIATGATSYLWQDGTTGNSLTVSGPGIYWVEVSNVCGVDRDSIVVDYAQNAAVVVDGDVNGCEGETYTLTANAVGAANYLWNDGSTGQTLTVSTAGIYWVEVGNPTCGSARDSAEVTITALPTVSLGPDTTICEGQAVKLEPVATGLGHLLWQDGSNGPSLPVNAPGTYWVEAYNHCGSAADSLELTLVAAPTVSLGADTTICEDMTITLVPDGAFAAYLWQDGSTAPEFVVSEQGIFTVQVANEFGCTAESRVQILTEYCNRGLYVPTAFTPNGDGNNDYFFPVENEVAVIDFKVFDRWGMLIYESTTAQPGWDGRLHEQPVQEGA
ncbi:MAG: T9SS type B sorting domain-containing protein, partial [Bacteroidota bacterium]